MIIEKYKYDEKGRLAEIFISGMKAFPERTVIKYNDNDQVIEQTVFKEISTGVELPESITHYDMDDNGRINYIIDPTGRTVYEYKSNGTVITRFEPIKKSDSRWTSVTYHEGVRNLYPNCEFDLSYDTSEIKEITSVEDTEDKDDNVKELKHLTEIEYRKGDKVVGFKAYEGDKLIKELRHSDKGNKHYDYTYSFHDDPDEYSEIIYTTFDDDKLKDICYSNSVLSVYNLSTRKLVSREEMNSELSSKNKEGETTLTATIKTLYPEPEEDDSREVFRIVFDKNYNILENRNRYNKEEEYHIYDSNNREIYYNYKKRPNKILIPKNRNNIMVLEKVAIYNGNMTTVLSKHYKSRNYNKEVSIYNKDDKLVSKSITSFTEDPTLEEQFNAAKESLKL